MENTMKIFNEEDVDIWRQAFQEDETVEKFKVTNESDYSGVMFVIEWNWKKSNK